MAEFSHQTKPQNRPNNPLPRRSARAIQGRRQGRRHLRQRHHGGVGCRYEESNQQGIRRVVYPMGVHPLLPTSPYEVSPPETRWIPVDLEKQRQLVGPFVRELRLQVQAFRSDNYQGATETSKSLLRHWFHTPHFLEGGRGGKDFQYYFAQREALETLVYLFDVLKI